MNLTVVRLTAGALLGRRRVLLLLPMPVLLIGLTLIGVAEGQEPENWGPIVLGQLGLGVILPLTALIIGTSVLGLEIEDHTIIHVLAKPVPRYEIVHAKLAVAFAVTSVTTALPLAACGAIAESSTLAVALAVGAAIGALAYSALFLALSLITRRPVAAGLVYIMLWENVLTQYVDGAKVFSVQQYTSTIADKISGSPLLESELATATAAILAAVFVVLGTVLASTRLRSFSLTGETG
jgi:ABC-2 type transport system permease protein